MTKKREIYLFNLKDLDDVKWSKWFIDLICCYCITLNVRLSLYLGIKVLLLYDEQDNEAQRHFMKGPLHSKKKKKYFKPSVTRHAIKNFSVRTDLPSMVFPICSRSVGL